MSIVVRWSSSSSQRHWMRDMWRIFHYRHHVHGEWCIWDHQIISCYECTSNALCSIRSWWCCAIAQYSCSIRSKVTFVDPQYMAINLSKRQWISRTPQTIHCDHLVGTFVCYDLYGTRIHDCRRCCCLMFDAWEGMIDENYLWNNRSLFVLSIAF